MKVGFIGLGHMGAGMAANLLKAGHDVTVYKPDTHEDLAEPDDVRAESACPSAG